MQKMCVQTGRVKNSEHFAYIGLILERPLKFCYHKYLVLLTNINYIFVISGGKQKTKCRIYKRLSKNITYSGPNSRTSKFSEPPPLEKVSVSVLYTDWEHSAAVRVSREAYNVGYPGVY